MIFETTDILVDSRVPKIFYQYGILYSITGYTTSMYSGGSTEIVSGITITSGFTLNLYDFVAIDKLDIIENLVDYVYDELDANLNKYMINILIVDETSSYNNVNQISQYLVKLSLQDNCGNKISDYLIMNVIDEISIPVSEIYTPPIYITPVYIPNNIETTQILVDSVPPIIVYNHDIVYNVTGYTTSMYSGGSTEIVSGITITSGFTLNLYDFVAIDKLDIIENLVDYVYDELDDLNKYMINILIVDETSSYNNVNQISQYLVKLSLQDNCGNKISDYLIMNVIDEISIPVSEIYTPPIYVPMALTNTIVKTTQVYLDSEPPIIVYNYDIIYNVTGATTSIYSGVSAEIESGVTVTSGFTLNLYDSISVDYIDIIENIVDYIYDKMNTELSKYMIDVLILDEIKIYNIVTQTSKYLVKISLTDNEYNISDYFIMDIINELIIEPEVPYSPPISTPIVPKIKDVSETTEIYIDSETPTIAYQYGVLSDYDSNTDLYSGVSSGITSGITISKIFLLNIQGFDDHNIDRLDIIDNVVDYVYDSIDLNVNKYMLEVLIVDKNLIYTQVNNAGDYCIKLKITDRFGNSYEDYLIMRVVEGVEDVACFPGGIWRDNKVWIDTFIWKDYL